MLPASVKTASREDSIWKKLSEDEFRKNIVSLAQASNSVPADARDYSLTDWESRHPNDSNAQRRLSLDDERRIADDLAYIAASREGGEAVSAVTLEEQVKSPGLTVRLAANRSIPKQVPEQLKAVFRFLRSRSGRGVHHELNAKAEMS
ncbi:MAG: hypothetical protein Q9179_001839 [Wetmoreana sp. 5 TL-2023]